MGKKRKVRFRLLSILSIAFLVLPLMFPNMGHAEANSSPHTSLKKSSLESTKSKISSRLQDEFDKQDQVTFLIKFKEQSDPAAAAKKAEKNALNQNLTPAKAKYMKRSAVLSALRSTAIETQGSVADFLQKQEKEGKAKEIQSFYIVNAIAVTATKDVMEQVAAFPEVEKVLPNEMRQLHIPEKVAEKPSMQLGKEPKANTNAIEWNIERVGAPAVWEMGIDGSGTVVASIDTGVQWDHPALKEKYRGYNPANPNSPTHEFNWFDATAGRAAAYDDQGHGTHVTGTMVGSEPNGANQIGVAPGAKWIAVKAFTASGGSDSDLLAAGEWILAPKDAAGNPHPEKAPDVVNNSWGGGPGLDEWYRPMVQAWRAAEIFPEFSAGNTRAGNPGGPGSIANPANYPESYATGATDINNGLGSFSLQGPSPYGEIKPDIAAPGVNIRSSVPGSNYEGGWNGTSMAGPHVSAVAALLRQVDSSLTVEEIEEILMTTATPLTNGTYPTSPNNGFGSGLVNAFDAVSSVISGLGKIKGQVAKEGNDDEAPQVEHNAPQETYAGMDLPLELKATDNVSVLNVVLEYLKSDGSWATVQASRVSGDYQDGTYSAAIPGDDIAVPSVSYKWKVNDFGGNEVGTDTYQVSVKPGITVGYSQDFESEPIGWTSYGVKNSWQWGVPTSGPSKAASGEKVFATNLAGNYDTSANMTLVMPPIDLPEGNAFLQFKQWHNLERNYDYGHVFVSTDMENWTQKLRVNDITADWVNGEVDLSEYAGQRIYVGFNVTTDGSVVRPGWYIDDVQLANTPLQASNKAQLGTTKSDTAKNDSKAALKDEKVEPNKIAPKKDALVKDEGSQKQPAPALLPITAEVSILESGRSVFTNPQDGTYEFTHASGSFTIQAEAYGYRSQSQTVNVPQDGEATANFVLEEIPQGTVTGTVTNEATGEPISNATLLLVEDAAVQPVETNANGEYSLTAYEGTYTLKVMAPSYYSQEIAVTISEGTIEQNVQLKPFIGYPGEIGYDDGTAENARAFYDAGNGWAVKMSLAEGQKSAMVTGGLFRFWDTEWPVPGGTGFKVEVYDASGPDGAPGKKLAGPFDATALRNGEWTHVDLSEHGIMVNGDFYMVYIQSAINTSSPGLATDENGPNAKRSWQLVGGAWTPSPAEEGNYMIRSTVNYEVTAPVITSPKDGDYTKEGTVKVEGTTSPAATVKIFNNDEEIATTEATASGTFSAEVSLTEGENILTAKVTTDLGSTDASNPVKIIFDQTSPELEIISPEDKSQTNKETVTVEGTVSDEHLESVKVNGQDAKITDGKFSLRILLNEGENIITVAAQDKAGNKTEKTVTIHAVYTAPAIENLLPTEDKELKKGESVKIEFDSAPGLKATFAIRMPLTNAGDIANATELPMMETAPGHYVGYYTATSNVKAPGAEIEVKVTDEFGNETRKVADGKLYINEKKKKEEDKNDGSKDEKDPEKNEEENGDARN
ncbi:S8 family serine peptidase [Cytobacillus praedii]|uniref:S8 family serine peptidase n=1 Tax=Cytobacillus praedii TaxID=1742358 RepID=UPI002E202519|nr:S8 family serine peptidase [Cytobacillus praedii]MED3554018.1 S8 family serine peptidase [Cytobacillus praedii]